MEMILPWLMTGGCGVITLAPAILAVVAIIDMVRTGSDWYWLLIILFVPVIGPIAYFLVVRGPWGGGRFASVSPTAARRAQAQQRLRALSVQLAHWRGPALLVEAGEELLALGKTAEAEQHLREALEAGAEAKEVAFPLAQALQVQGRFEEALPLLTELCAAEPNAEFGQAQLHLGRVLDELGRADEAESALRTMLERHSNLEAKVRLARLLLRRDENAEAQALLQEVKSDAEGLPPYLRRAHRAWIKTAKKLQSGDQALPGMSVEGAIPKGYRLRLGLSATALGVLGLLGVGSLLQISSCPLGINGEIMAVYEERQVHTLRLGELDDEFPWTHDDDLAEVVLTAAEVDRFLSLRRDLSNWAAQAETAPRESNGTIDSWTENARRLNRGLANLATLMERHAVGPASTNHLFALVDWRFLERADALPFGVPPHFRYEWFSSSEEIYGGAEHGVDYEIDPELRRELERAQQAQNARMADLEKLARADTAVSAETRELLEARREELEQFQGRDAYEQLARMLTNPVADWTLSE